MVFKCPKCRNNIRPDLSPHAIDKICEDGCISCRLQKRYGVIIAFFSEDKHHVSSQIISCDVLRDVSGMIPAAKLSKD